MSSNPAGLQPGDHVEEARLNTRTGELTLIVRRATDGARTEEILSPVDATRFATQNPDVADKMFRDWLRDNLF